MKLIGLNPLLEDAKKHHYAVGAFNFCNAETAQAIAEVASELRSPLMYIIGPWELPLLGAKTVAKIAQWVASEADVPVCLHLDHAVDIETVRECIEAGFPSVMMDASQYDFEENVRLTKTVVDLAHSQGLTVEGELGAVGRVGDSGGATAPASGSGAVAPRTGGATAPASGSGAVAPRTSVEGGEAPSLTDPEKAAEFVERTGVDALAVAIGNAHGIYTQRPSLDFDLLRAIRRATDVALVLHGGSGTASDQLHRAIEIGVSKVNVASELARAYLNAIRSADDAVWYAHAIMDAKSAVKQVTAKWMRELGCAGAISDCKL